MRISERFRAICENVVDQLAGLERLEEESLTGAVKALRGGAEELTAFLDTVGEIPQIKLEQRLSPILLQAHGKLDRARVLLEAEGMQQRADETWELEQQIYRLLNDL